MPIYAEKCAPCHGDRGLGDGPDAARLPNPVAAIGSPEVARKSIPAEWARIIRDGKMDRFFYFLNCKTFKFKPNFILKRKKIY